MITHQFCFLLLATISLAILSISIHSGIFNVSAQSLVGDVGRLNNQSNQTALSTHNNNTKVNGTAEAWMDAGIRVQ